MKRWPNFFIVGAPKAGTTSLHDYLNQHPKIFLPTIKEIHFFDISDSRKSEKIQKIRQGENYNNDDGFLAGAHLSQAIVYNRFKFIIQEGFYLRTPKEIDKRKMYNKVIFNYSINPKVSIHLALKSYLEELKYASIGVGYKL